MERLVFATFTFKMKTRKAELVFTMKTGMACGIFAQIFHMKTSLAVGLFTVFAMATGKARGIFAWLIFTMRSLELGGIFSILGLGVKG